MILWEVTSTNRKKEALPFPSRSDKVLAYGEDSLALRLVSKLPDLRAVNANLRPLRPEP